jgi:DNA-binding NarL/FixJ family response regulator
MAERGKPLPFAVKQSIREQTAAGAKIKPLARELEVSRNTVRKYKSK